MAIPLSTPLNAQPRDSYTYAELLDYLNSVLSEVLRPNSFVRADGKQEITTLLGDLCCIVLAEFPQPDVVAEWSSLSENVVLIDATLKVIDRALVCVERIVGGPDRLERIILAQMLSFGGIMDTWIYSNQCPEDVVDGPTHLKSQAQEVALNLLEVLAGMKSENREYRRPTESTEGLRDCLDECLRVAKDLSSKDFTEPVKYLFFENQSNTEDATIYPSVWIPSATVLDALISDSLLLAARGTITLAKLATYSYVSVRVVKATTTHFAKISYGPQGRRVQERSRQLAQLLDVIEALSAHGPSCLDAVIPCMHKLIAKRQGERPAAAWGYADQGLLRVLKSLPEGTELGFDCAWFEDRLSSRSSDEEGNHIMQEILYQCLRISTPKISPNKRERLTTLLTEQPHSVERDAILTLLQPQPPAMNIDNVAEQARSRTWRLKVHVQVLDWFFAKNQDAYPFPEGFEDVEWCTSVIQAVLTCITRWHCGGPHEDRLEALRHLIKLPCFLTHVQQKRCVRDTVLPGLSVIPAFVSMGVQLLEAAGSKVTAEYAGYVYELFAQAAKHHSQGFGGSKLEEVVRVVKYGMQRQERQVRLKAGRVLKELIPVCQSTLRGSAHRAEPLLRTVDELLNGNSFGILETTLISSGNMGRLAQGDILGRLLLGIISQLGHQNPVLKGLAYMQLLDINTAHGKGPYSLLSPYLPKIAIAAVSTVSSNPEQLLQICAFLNMSPSKFYNLTISHFLPHLVCTCNGEAIVKVGRELRKSPVALVTTHDVLACVFLLNGQAETDRIFDFILDLLMQSANAPTSDITVLMLVKSTVVPLLGEIVIAMGDDDPVRAKLANEAIAKVERSLSSERGNRDTPLLNEYLMGVISHLNEVLQDVHGKRSLDVKRKVMRSLGALIEQVGSQVTSVAPQIMATLQSMLPVPMLMKETLSSWYTFITKLALKDIRPYIGPTSAAFVIAWNDLKAEERQFVQNTFKYLIIENAEVVERYSNEFVGLETIAELQPYFARLLALRTHLSPMEHLDIILARTANDNLTVAELSLQELKEFMISNQAYILKHASDDVFDPLVNRLAGSLWEIACRDGDGVDPLRLLAYECIGRLGAVDPDRLDLATKDPELIMYDNFGSEEESIQFALYLIKDILLGTFRSTSDIKFQSHLAFAIQELLKFCGFTKDIIASHPVKAVPTKTRARWRELPSHVLEACTPLLEAKYTRTSKSIRPVQHPVYPSKATYREWMQDWTAHLIDRVSQPRAKAIFDVFRAVVIDKDVGVARHLLPHLVLHILISGDDADTQNIREEIIAVLTDQVEPSRDSSGDRRLLCAQAVFMLMDHLNKWIRAMRQGIAQRRADSKRSRLSDLVMESEDNLTKVDSLLASIDRELIAKAAFECKAYARALMNFERQIQNREERGISSDDPELQVYYERLHEIYSHLDEPDGMEGVNSRVLNASLEHQIRQHESMGHWTSAQSCWEVRLQESPDNLEYHIGLLRCLRNLGHYDTLRTHIKGVLNRNPDWHEAMSGFQAEGAWIVGDWQNVQELVDVQIANPPPELSISRVLLAMREGDSPRIAEALSISRAQLGMPIHAAGSGSYRRAYDSVLNLHLVRDIEIIYESTLAGSARVNPKTIRGLSERLSRRLESTQPSFRIREPVLSLQRTALSLSDKLHKHLKPVIGQAWVATSKIARKAGHIQTAYSAILQAQCKDVPFHFLQSVKLIKATGEPIRALQELEKALTKAAIVAEREIIDLTEQEPDPESMKMKAKTQILRAQWMYDAERSDKDLVHKCFKEAVSIAPNWESAHFHLGNFYDRQIAELSLHERNSPGSDLIYQTIKCYTKTLQSGSKYVYQTMPRLLTLWLDLGDTDNTAEAKAIVAKANNKITSAMRSIATYKWLTAFPQIVSRIDHRNKAVFETLSNLIMKIMEEYPHQGVWLFMSVVQSKKAERNRRGEDIISKIMANPRNVGAKVTQIITECRAMTNELLKLCSHVVAEEPKLPLSMAKLFPGLARLAPSQLIVPLQESLIASLPSESSLEASHQPFPHHLPTIHRFDDAVEVMKSLAKPRKLTLLADNGKIFSFLGKPKDDLRKDARLMDFNALINKLLKKDSDSRRRQLHIRTYSVVTLNEESGLIQWVPNTVPMRPVLIRSYEIRNIQIWGTKVHQAFAKIKEINGVEQQAEIFAKEILPAYPPVFHEWFIDTFPEPSAWLASRLSFARTAAVMSMVGYILGLGDRHSENILLDMNTGSAIHVDFDCLFERGKRLETPERVPFRLTQNMQDGLGVTNVDGPFRIACEITMGLLRRNKDCLMSVLDAFVHDPLVEWEDEKKRMEKSRKTLAQRKKAYTNALKDEVDLRQLAKGALMPIQKKLQGIYTPWDSRDDGKEMSTSNLVDALIQDAKSLKNLARMYPGWGPFL